MSILKVENIYNTLFKFEESKKQKLYPIHKKLQFKSNTEFQNFEDISDWVTSNIKLNQSSKILDAGCGVGYVLLKLCKAYNCNGFGISLSNKEIEAAKINARNEQLKKSCLFRVQNFDDIKNETFDLIIAIESIKHSNKIQHTLKQFNGYLNENGKVVIVEDFLSPSYKNHSLTKAFSIAWNVPCVYTEVEFNSYAKEANLNKADDIDLTSFIKKKNSFLSRIKIVFIEIALFFVRNIHKQTQLNIYKGALIMDYFYSKGIFEYKLKVYKKL